MSVSLPLGLVSSPMRRSEDDCVDNIPDKLSYGSLHHICLVSGGRGSREPACCPLGPLTHARAWVVNGRQLDFATQLQRVFPCLDT